MIFNIQLELELLFYANFLIFPRAYLYFSCSLHHVTLRVDQKCSFGVFCEMFWKNLNEYFGQASILKALIVYIFVTVYSSDWKNLLFHFL